jgi:hypothetical protein
MEPMPFGASTTTTTVKTGNTIYAQHPTPESFVGRVKRESYDYDEEEDDADEDDDRRRFSFSAPSRNRIDRESSDVSPTAEPQRKKQKRNKPTLSCFECVERKTKARQFLL